MLSLIVCHRNKKQLTDFKLSAANTIIGAYELIVIDNSQNKHSIFEAYNMGVQQAKGDILAFCHEDILFHTNGWDQLLVNHFEYNNKLGLIGVVGGTALPKAPAPWWNHHSVNTHFINNIQHWANDKPASNQWEGNRKIKDGVYHHQNNPTKKTVNEVVAVDGFFMACPAAVFESIIFDTDSFKGFHCYDVDTCLQVKKAGYQVAVVHDILIEHTSQGSTNLQWAESAIICARKWKNTLPLTIGVHSPEQLLQYNTSSLLTFCYWSMEQLGDKQLRSIISEFLPNNTKWPVLRQQLFLILWKYLGYQTARFPYKLLKIIFND